MLSGCNQSGDTRFFEYEPIKSCTSLTTKKQLDNEQDGTV
jgi:hypothetical protein